jgi:hypothetical protein
MRDMRPVGDFFLPSLGAEGFSTLPALSPAAGRPAARNPFLRAIASCNAVAQSKLQENFLLN